MTSYRFNALSRSALRREITRHDDWPMHRITNELKDASQLTVKLLNKIGADMGIDVSRFDIKLHPTDWQGEEKPVTDDRSIIDDMLPPEQVAEELLRQNYEERKRQERQELQERQERQELQELQDELENPLEKINDDLSDKPAKSNKSMAEQLASSMAEQLERALDSQADKAVDEAAIIKLINKHSAKPAQVDVHVYKAPDMKVESRPGLIMHFAFPLLLSAVMNEVNVMLVGPAGSGKTTAAEQVADMLKLDFSFTGAIDSSYKLSGFIDAQGKIVNTAFRRAYENGGVFLFDEMDASLPSATLAFNAALANGHADFPDGIIKRHADFRAIAACNTFGTGASRQYVGRNQQDAASLDRFAVLVWDYDERLESAILGHPAPVNAPTPETIMPVKDSEKVHAMSADWLVYVQRIRRAVEKLSVRHVVSPRASIMGTKLLAAGWSRKAVETSCLFKGLDAETISKLTSEAR